MRVLANPIQFSTKKFSLSFSLSLFFLQRHTQGRRYTQHVVRIIIIIMGRTPVKLKEVIYGISSNKVEIMGSLGRDALSAISKKIGGGWFDVTVFGIAPTVGTVM